ncbi:MAG: hypothetical protein R2755_17270 [Acidimicrobiales bacterium]
MMDITHPFVIEGNDLVTKGVEDAHPIEGGIYQQYSVEKQAFVKQKRRHLARRRVAALRVEPVHQHVRVT